MTYKFCWLLLFSTVVVNNWNALFGTKEKPKKENWEQVLEQAWISSTAVPITRKPIDVVVEAPKETDNLKVLVVNSLYGKTIEVEDCYEKNAKVVIAKFKVIIRKPERFVFGDGDSVVTRKDLEPDVVAELIFRGTTDEKGVLKLSLPAGDYMIAVTTKRGEAGRSEVIKVTEEPKSIMVKTNEI